MLKTVRRKSAQTGSAKTIGFRLEDKYSSVLADQASALNISIHELARGYVIEALRERETKDSLFEILAMIHSEMGEMRKDISLSTEALLSGAGKFDENEARAWTEQNLNAS